MRHPQLINSNHCGLLVIDIQEKFIPAIFEAKKMIESSVKLVKAFTLLERPVLVTEQYPKGLGKTVEPISSLLPGLLPVEKLSFSCCAVPDFDQMLRKRHIHHVVLCGIETHVCLWQTAMDLQAGGFEVIVIEDAVSSRHSENKSRAIERFKSQKIQVADLEMILFELLQTAEHPHFKEIQSLIK